MSSLDIALYLFSAILVLIGLAGTIVPALPGIPLIFAGLWLAAGTDGYRHVGTWWLAMIAVLGAIGFVVDFVATAMGAKRVGASRLAIWGAMIGTVTGMFFGIPGLLLGPFVGAVIGELMTGNSVLRSTHVGVGTWLGWLLGTLVKLVISLAMIGLFGFAWLVN